MGGCVDGVRVRATSHIVSVCGCVYGYLGERVASAILDAQDSSSKMDKCAPASFVFV